MKTLCEIIKEQVEANFLNLETAIRTYNRNAPVCGVPAWRYVYHTIHSADKWFFNPFVYEEPPFHEEGMDNPDNPCTAELSDSELLEYLGRVKQKTFDYLDRLTDKELYECPENCSFTRMDLVLIQFRHISFHTGMLNGQTVELTGKFPVYVSPHTADRLDKGLFEE
ncbi:MAG: DinB family protein [Ruminococcaceae bacterium]|nr:DinB family protein [Oscillospiraceae bacterium]